MDDLSSAPRNCNDDTRGGGRIGFQHHIGGVVVVVVVMMIEAQGGEW